MILESPTVADAAAPFITRAPHSLSAWADHFDRVDFPVLGSTADSLEELRANEDSVDAHTLAETLAPDPLMTLKVLAHVARLRRGREGGDPESVTGALVLLGISPFFRAFGPQARVEERLSTIPAAMDGFRSVLDRSHRAATFALAFAVQRMDHDATIIQQAALLHDFAELLLWLHAPSLALEIARRQQVDPSLRSAAVQRQVLNVELPALQHLLMQRWRLPAHLIDIADDLREAASPQARTVMLAIRLARHTAGGWENAALPDDIREIAELLHMAPEPTLALLRDIDAR